MFSAAQISYEQTHSFSRIVLDYLNGAADLRSFYQSPATLAGIKDTILKKEKQRVDRKLLVELLNRQYEQLPVADAAKKNIESLLSENCFTICTAHQPNLFTGPLYFIYKILHAVR